METKKVVLKVLGALFGILFAIVLLSVIISKTLLPVYRYNSAEKSVQAGNYAAATMRLKGMDYKDSAEKFGEYALIAGEEYFKSGDYDNASLYLTYALNSENEKASAKAKAYFEGNNQ